MNNNSNKTDTHIYNIINNPPKVFTEPCVACGVSEFQLGVKHAEERIIKLLKNEEWHHIAFATRDPDDEPTKYHDGECFGCRQIALIKGEQK